MPYVFKSVFNVIVRCQSACQNKSMFRAMFMEWYFLDPVLKSYNSFMFKRCFQILKINAFSSILGYSNYSCKQTKNYNFFLSIHFEEYIFMTKIFYIQPKREKKKLVEKTDLKQNPLSQLLLGCWRINGHYFFIKNTFKLKFYNQLCCNLGTFWG